MNVMHLNACLSWSGWLVYYKLFLLVTNGAISYMYTEPHFQRKMFLEDNFNSRIFKTKFGVVKSISLHVLPVHTSQLTILPRFTEHWYVRSKPVLLRCTCNHDIFSHLSVHEVYDTIAD